ncbi:hypothetical protein F6X40_11365 [Paraburkholderia sp. UCT31]|uniref:hypothetical protein n=1 Tax=Paraburkholderia sp. UCT31 TaxID=2615209 RepID=UPI00165530D3|nr:hypothetical protein [Paraburkholderia sp. UCT31]MBC8737403.1 hypothetical protein [Paraburkholderia sp. UCT31]
MGSQIYLVDGPGLPTKLCVVDFRLEHEVLLEIENRFQRTGYDTLRSVHNGVIELADPISGPRDSFMLPGTDDAAGETDGEANGGAQARPGVLAVRETPVESGRRAWLLRFTGEEGVAAQVVVLPEPVDVAGQTIFDSLKRFYPAGQLEVKKILAGSFLVSPAVVASGFQAEVTPQVKVAS